MIDKVLIPTALLALMGGIADSKSLANHELHVSAENHREVKKVSAQPWSYASFIISPGKRWPDATILVEDQDAFEFPDKKIRVRVKGPNYYVERKKEEQIFLNNEADDDLESVENLDGADDNSAQPSAAKHDGNTVDVLESSTVEELEKISQAAEKSPQFPQSLPPMDSDYSDSNKPFIKKISSGHEVEADPTSDARVTDGLEDSAPDEVATGTRKAGGSGHEGDVARIAVDRFVEGGSVFWFDQDRSLYVADAFGQKIYRYSPSGATDQSSQAADKKLKDHRSVDFVSEVQLSHEIEVLQEPLGQVRTPVQTQANISDVFDEYQEHVLDLGVLGTVGPVVPQEFNANLSLVTLSLGFNTDIFNSVSWSLDNLQDVDFPKRDRVGVMEVDRYHRLTFAQVDPVGRIVTGSVDVRSQLSPHPCLDFLVLEDPVTGRTNLSMSEARKAGVVCSPRGVAFSGYDTMLYLDGITANLVSFDYNVKERSLGRHRVLASHSESEVKPSAMVVESNGNYVWIGFQGNGKIMRLDIKGMEQVRTLTVGEPDVVDLSLGEDEKYLFVLTKYSLFRINIK